MKNIIIVLLLSLFMVGCVYEITPVTTTTETTTTTLEPIDYEYRLVNTETLNELPLDDVSKIRELAIIKYGSEEIINCSGENMELLPPRDWNDIFMDEHGYYGSAAVGGNIINGYTVSYKCMLRLNETVRVPVFIFVVDPNNGFIHHFECSTYRVDNCPEVPIFLNAWDKNPNYDTYKALT